LLPPPPPPGAYAAATPVTAPVIPPPQPLACTNQGEGGPTCGTSLALMVRLMYSHIWYDAAYVSLENGWFTSNATSSFVPTPIYNVQLGARSFVQQHGSPGVHMATNALFLDYHQGWTVPRQLYSGSIYRAWGNLPYAVERGDYLIDNVLRMFYPGYQDSSYFHDETGFTAPTPFADSLDVMLSDAPAWLLQRYDTVIVAGTPSSELSRNAAKLDAFLQAGGRVIAWAGALGALGGLSGCTLAEAPAGVQPGGSSVTPWTASCPQYGAGTAVSVVTSSNGTTTTVIEPAAFGACTLVCTGNAAGQPQALATLQAAPATPLAWAVPVGANGGSLVVFGSPFGAALDAVSISGNGIDESLTTPYPMLNHVFTLASAQLSASALFSTAPGLTLTIARRTSTWNTTTSPDIAEYALLVSNPSLQQAPFYVTSNVGAIISLVEVPIATDVKNSTGYLPDGFQGYDIGASTNTTIAGADTRVFFVVVDETDAAARRRARGAGGMGVETASASSSSRGCGAACLRGGTAGLAPMLPAETRPVVAAAAALPAVTPDSTAAAAPVAVQLLPLTPPPARAVNFGLNVRGLLGVRTRTLRELVLSYPSVSQVFDALAVTWDYVNASDVNSLVAEAAWLRQRGLTVMVDASAGMNLFPVLRMCNNSAPEFAATLATLTTVMDRMAAAGWRHLILSLHRTPENNMDASTALQLMGETLQALASTAAPLNVSLHLRYTGKNGIGNLDDSLQWLAAAGVSLGQVAVMPNTAEMLIQGDAASSLGAVLAAPGPVILGVSAPQYDITGAPFTETWPITAAVAADQLDIFSIVAAACATRICQLGPAAAAADARARSTILNPPLIVLVDAYIGDGAAGTAQVGNYAGLQVAPGMDLAYAEAEWVVGAAAVA
jgi:hypothetical protein